MRLLLRARNVLNKARLRIDLSWKVLTRFEPSLARSSFKVSYSQSGEDMIIWFLFEYLGIKNPTYLDVGAHDPERLSNSALFYMLGGRGINIEPDPKLFAQFPRSRPRDINLNIGIGATRGVMRLFRMSDSSLSTFAEEEALRMSKDMGIAIVDSIDVPILTLREVLGLHKFRPDLISLDAEGKDLEILQAYDFSFHRPAVFCVETVSFSLRGDGRKNEEIARLMGSNGYRSYADTYVNTIYVDEARFRSSDRP